MPDLFSHLAAAHIVRRSVELKREQAFHGQDYTMFYLGSILPDLVSKTIPIMFDGPRIHWAVAPTHTPLGLLLMSYGIALLFNEKNRKRFFLLLILGAVFHLLLDVLQKHLTDGAYYWFFPFSWKSFHIPVFWPSDSIIAIPFLLFVIIVCEIAMRNKKIV